MPELAFDSLSAQAIRLQYEMIAENKHPLGSKNLLEAMESQGNYGYNRTHKNIHPWLNDYLQKFGYYDIFIIDNNSNVVYSVFKELDYATNLEKGPWKSSGLAEAFHNSQTLKAGEVYFTDLALNEPSYNAPASFVSTPIFNKNKRIGTLVYQMPLARISEIMSVQTDGYKTLDSYLVGADGKLRSDSNIRPDAHNVLTSHKQGGTSYLPAIAQSLEAGNSKIGVTQNYLNNEVTTSVANISLGSHNWLMVTEVSNDEAYATLHELILFIAAITLASIFAIALIGSRIAVRTAKPIVSMAKTMDDISTHFDFNQRVAVTSKDEIGQASAALNNLLENTKNALHEVNHSVKAVASGDFNTQIESPMQGDLKTLKDGVNQSIHGIAEVMSELKQMMAAFSAGNFNYQVTSTPEGDYAVMLQKAQDTQSTLNSVIGNINHCVNNMRQGQFECRVTADADGSLLEMKDNFNASMDALSQAIAEINHVIESMAAGNLTNIITEEYQGELATLKEGLNASIARFDGIVGLSIQSAGIVHHSAAEVAQGSNDLSQRVQAQAAALEETSATMHEMNATIAENTAKANEARQLAYEVRQRSVDGQQIMQQNISAMNEIKSSSQEIADIVTMIDSIAFQTNLLALNAAVEAARVGEHGRGFAVVASEVRNLAMKSADAAKNIKSLIDSSVERIELGADLTQQSDESLQSIGEYIEQMSSIIEGIADASNEQAVGISQVNDTINNIDEMTQQNAALVEETSVSAENLNDQAINLSNNMAFFTTTSNVAQSSLKNLGQNTSGQVGQNVLTMNVENHNEETSLIDVEENEFMQQEVQQNHS